jgi:hypothetical protein
MISWRYFIIMLSCLIGISAVFWTSKQNAQDEQPLDWREELKQIDEEIKQSEDLKNRYLAEARRAEDKGMSWQFQQDQKQEAKRAFERADQKKQAAEMMQARIDQLKARRAQILQEHKEANELQRSS